MRQLTSRPIVILFIFVAALFFFYFFKQTPASHEKETTARFKKEAVVRNSQQVLQANSQDNTKSSNNENSAVLTENQKTQIQYWISTESKTMNQPHVDTQQKDIELKKRVENFSDAEKKVILETAYDISKTANERILAAYMMVLDQSEISVTNLGALAQKALPDFGPVTAHSEAEIRRGQELAVRYMAVDELGKRAQGNPEALEQLKKLASGGESAEVRGYAQRVLKEMKPK